MGRTASDRISDQIYLQIGLKGIAQSTLSSFVIVVFSPPQTNSTLCIRSHRSYQLFLLCTAASSSLETRSVALRREAADECRARQLTFKDLSKCSPRVHSALAWPFSSFFFFFFFLACGNASVTLHRSGNSPKGECGGWERGGGGGGG